MGQHERAESKKYDAREEDHWESPFLKRYEANRGVENRAMVMMVVGQSRCM